MTEDNFELLGLLRDNIDLESLRVKGVDKDKRNLKDLKGSVIKGLGFTDQEHFD